jgi:hypothetical protein
VKYFVATICLFSSSLAVNAQEITGTWEEHSKTRFTSYTKLSIARICSTYIGYTYDRDDDGGYCKAFFTWSLDKKKKKLQGEGTSFLEQTPGHVLAIYKLFYRVREGEEYLEGTIYMKPDSTMKLFINYDDPLIQELIKPEYIQLKRVSKNVDSIDYMRLIASAPCNTNQPVVSSHPDELKIIEKPVADSPVIVLLPPMVAKPDAEQKVIEKPVADSPVVVLPEKTVLEMQMTRVNDTLYTLPITEKELTIRVMDNAIIDGDTISIIHNGKLIAERILVSGKSFPLQITLSKENPYHELILVAHNLGSIPPNTALVTIDTGNNVYHLYALADLRKNALIIIKYTGH